MKRKISIVFFFQTFNKSDVFVVNALRTIILVEQFIAMKQQPRKRGYEIRWGDTVRWCICHDVFSCTQREILIAPFQ